MLLKERISTFYAKTARVSHWCYQCFFMFSSRILKSTKRGYWTACLYAECIIQLCYASCFKITFLYTVMLRDRYGLG